MYTRTHILGACTGVHKFWADTIALDYCQTTQTANMMGKGGKSFDKANRQQETMQTILQVMLIAPYGIQYTTNVVVNEPNSG